MPEDLLQRPATDPIAIYRYRDGLYAVDLITAAIVHLDFVSWLAEHPATMTEICAHFGLVERPADVLVTVFAANGWIERRADGICVVTPTAREFLTAGSPWSLVPYYASLADRPLVADFLSVLRTGRPAAWSHRPDGFDWHKAMADETFAREFTAAMDCRGRYLAQGVAAAAPFAGRARLLDIGGGSGIYACSLAAHHPHLAATVFDQPPVDQLAARLIAERGLADRVGVYAGNFLDDGWPRGYDVHLFSNVLHDWDAPDVAALLERSFAALDPGGLVVIHDAFINADKTGPLPVAEYSAILMHATQGKCYATSEYEAFLAAAGFVEPKFTETAADRGVMFAKKPSR
jgi:acetylserotonin N-methyltransferase